MATDTTTQKMTDWFSDYMAKQQNGGTSSFSASSLTPSTLSMGSLTQRTVAPGGNETVAGQLNGIIASDSPYMQRARSSAMETANSRGLLNSSIAATAGERAAIDAALPIAQADASTFKSASDYNTALANEAQKYNAEAKNTFTLKGADINTSMAQKQMDIDAQRAAQVAEQSGKMQLQEAQAKADAEKSRTTSLINNILMTTDLSPDRKAALLTAMNAPELANAIYVVNSTAADLVETPSMTENGGPVNGSY